jgi:hypothetical protein
MKVVGCSPDLVLIQSLAIHFRKPWQILRNRKCVLTTPRCQALLSINLPVSVTMIEKEIEKEKDTEKEKEKEEEKENKKVMEKETEKEREKETENEREKEVRLG